MFSYLGVLLSLEEKNLLNPNYQSRFLSPIFTPSFPSQNLRDLVPSSHPPIIIIRIYFESHSTLIRQTDNVRQFLADKIVSRTKFHMKYETHTSAKKTTRPKNEHWNFISQIFIELISIDLIKEVK